MADTYDRVRPTYPAELFEAVYEYAGLTGSVAGEPSPDRETRLCECGAGTGKATMVVAPRAAEAGWSLTCVEPDAAMAAVLERRLSAITDLRAEVVLSGFEAYAEAVSGGDRPHSSLVFAAQAWHWVSPERRVAAAAAVLEDGGTLALIWNVARPHPRPLQVDLDEAYAEVRRGGTLGRHARHGGGPPGAAGSGSATIPPSSPQPLGVGLTPQSRAGYDREVAADGRFSPVTAESRYWVSRHDTDEWLTLLRTHSDHRMLEPDVLERLLERVRRIVDSHGGMVEVEYDAVALLTRRLPRLATSG